MESIGPVWRLPHSLDSDPESRLDFEEVSTNWDASPGKEMTWIDEDGKARHGSSASEILQGTLDEAGL